MALQRNDKARLRTEAIRALRGELADRTAELKLRAIWKLGDLISNAVDGDDDEDIMRRLRMLEEEEGGFDPYGEEEEEEDEAAKWLRQEEERIRQQELEKRKQQELEKQQRERGEQQRERGEQQRERGEQQFPMERGSEEEWQSPSYSSERFGSISLISPAGAAWPEDPGPPPPFFPLTEADVKNIGALREAFQRTEVWDRLERIAKDPDTAHSIQQWLLPKVILLVGRRWWQNNKNRKQLGSGIPFGLLNSNEYAQYRSTIDSSPPGKSWILQVNRLVTMLLARFLATKGPGPQQKIDGYIQTSLYRHAIELAAVKHGIELRREPECAYCKFKRNTPGQAASLMTPAGAPSGVGTRPKLRMWQCKNCADDVAVQKDIARERGEEVSETQQRIEWLSQQLAAMGDRRDSPEWSAYYRELTELNDSLPEKRRLHQDAEKELDVRQRLLVMPRTHIICISDTCPGKFIPLTFVDWTDPFWRTDEGAEARRKLAWQYGVAEDAHQAREQSAEDEDDPWRDVGRGSGYRPPPEWMWSVPFFCPYERSKGVMFTPREAGGKGPMTPSGKRLGGLLADAPLTYMWRKPFKSTDPGGEKMGNNTIDEVRLQTGLDVDVDPGRVEEAEHKHLHQKELEARLGPLVGRMREAFEAQKDEHTALTGGAGHKTNRKVVLKHYLYEALINWSHDNELYFAGWIFGRKPKVRKKVDRRTGMEVGVIEFMAMDRDGATKVKAAILQAWVKEVLKREDGFDLLTASGKWARRGGRSWLTSAVNDGVPAEAYFVAPLKSFNNEVFVAPCGLKYGKGSPIGERSPRGKAYGPPRMAFVKGVWDYRDAAGSHDPKMPISVDDGDAVAANLRSLNPLVNSADYRNVYLQQNGLEMTEGDRVLVKALFMPGQGGWMALKEIDKVWKEHRKTAEEVKPR